MGTHTCVTVEWDIIFIFMQLANNFFCLYFFANLINSLPAFILLKNILKFSYIELVNVFFRTISPAFLMFLLIKVWQHFSFFKNASIDFSFNVALGIFSYIVFYTLFNFNEVVRTGVIHKLRCMTKLK